MQSIVKLNCVTNLHIVIIKINTHIFLSILGYMADEVCNLSAFTFMHRDDVRWVMVALRQSILFFIEIQFRCILIQIIFHYQCMISIVHTVNRVIG